MDETLQLAIREQFATAKQQRETATFGMWVFLITEVLLFGSLFVAYTVYRYRYPEAFTKGSSEMEYLIGAINTAVLICSSFTMALAVLRAEQGKMLRSALLLFSTMCIGLVFLGLKFSEYYQHYRDHKVPGISFTETGPIAGHVQMFFVFYFVMTGLHAIHMLIGLSLISVVLFRMYWGSVSATYSTPVEIVGLYWHLIDIVWVFLFAIFYIPGAHLR